MAEAELLAELELVVWLVVQLVQVLQEEVQSQGQWGWMRKIGVDCNMMPLLRHLVLHEFWVCISAVEGHW